MHWRSGLTDRGCYRHPLWVRRVQGGSPNDRSIASRGPLKTSKENSDEATGQNASPRVLRPNLDLIADYQTGIKEYRNRVSTCSAACSRSDFHRIVLGKDILLVLHFRGWLISWRAAFWTRLSKHIRQR